jgi:hypothetical protein
VCFQVVCHSVFTDPALPAIPMSTKPSIKSVALQVAAQSHASSSVMVRIVAVLASDISKSLSRRVVTANDLDLRLNWLLDHFRWHSRLLKF